MADGLSARLLGRAGALCLVAGYVDAIGYTELGGVFAANMTGNSVLLAIAAARGEGLRATAYALTLAAFFAGALAAAALRRVSGRAAVPLLAAVALMLLASSLSMPPDFKLALLASTMAFQGASVARFGPVALQTVVVTGTIVRLSETIVARLAPPPAPPEPGSMRLHAFAWIAYGGGAAAAVEAQRLMHRPLYIAAAVLLAVTIDVARERLR